MNDDVEVRHHPEWHRYEITVGGRLAGLMSYHEVEGTLVFDHTEIRDEFGGRGLGSILAREVLTDVSANGRRIVAQCPFLARWMTRNPQFDALIDPELTARLIGHA